VNRQRLLSILWGIEIIVGVLPAIIMLGMGLISYLVLLQVVPQLLRNGETAAMRTVFLATGTMVGGWASPPRLSPVSCLSPVFHQEDYLWGV
jgi:uncharacterized membrane protein YjjB (DUF3815 family)